MSEVRRNDERSRYELVIDGTIVGIAEFVLDGSTMVVPHTEIEPRMRGRGIGGSPREGCARRRPRRHRGRPHLLVRARKYIEQHPDEADLLAS